MDDPRALLISLRDHTDEMREHERQCFAVASRLPFDHVDVHAMIDGAPTRDQLQRYDALFFGGSGAYSVLDDIDWIQHGIDVMLEVIDLRIPTWASCFGFQGLALALGGQVVYDPERTEMGATQLTLTDAGRADPLLSALPSTFWAQEGHKDRVVTLPGGVTLLATGVDVEAQALKVDAAPFWASQFHPELTLNDTLARFRHYSAEYLGEADHDETLSELEAGHETPEMAEVLARLVRMGR